MSTRYSTPLKYTDGNGKERRTKVYFELDPLELMDWTVENSFEANRLFESIQELDEIREGDSRDLTQDEIRTLLVVVKLLTQISAGRPTEDGDYFIKDPNWTSSYAYRGFREFLLTNPKEMTEFLTSILDNEVMEKFTTALLTTNEESEVKESVQENRDSGPETIEKMREKIRLLESKKDD